MAKLLKSSKVAVPFSNFYPNPLSHVEYLDFIIYVNVPSYFIYAAFLNPLANASIPPICAINISFKSVDSLLTLASKFKPPGVKPP